jgi:hypothetical protein
LLLALSVDDTRFPWLRQHLAIENLRNCSYENKWVDIAGDGHLVSFPGKWCEVPVTTAWAAPNTFGSWIYSERDEAPYHGGTDWSAPTKQWFQGVGCFPPPVCCPGGQTYHVTFDGSLAGLGSVPLPWRIIAEDHYSGVVSCTICGADNCVIDLQCGAGVYSMTVDLFSGSTFLFQYNFVESTVVVCSPFHAGFALVPPSPHPFFHCTDPTEATVTD